MGKLEFIHTIFLAYEKFVDWIETKIAGRGWQSTFALNLTAHLIAMGIILLPLGGLYTALQLATTHPWVAGILAASVGGLTIAVVAWRMMMNWVDGVQLRQELSRTQFCPHCGRECSETTIVCPSCEKKIKR